jgi:hypothetical protein
VYAVIEELVEVEPVDALELKGIHRAMPAFNVVRFRDAAAPAEREPDPLLR